ncbi:pilus assembly protein PilC [Acinetobacter sp. MD2]|nr:pilus assembly protein PilC [Acinetobacter sp. MD2]
MDWGFVMKKEFQGKILSFTVSALMVAMLCQTTVKASDISIYSNATGGKTTITLMLDTSGSMAGRACDISSSYDEKLVGYDKEDSDTNPRYTRYYCYYYDKPQKKYYNRITRLKDAVFTLMDNQQLDSNTVSIGLGQFSTQTRKGNQISADGSSGRILVPAGPLNDAQRLAIKNAIARLDGANGTPTANAYAEVAAYMLGTNTTANIQGMREAYVSTGGYWRGYPEFGKCTQWSGLYCTYWQANSGLLYGTQGAPTQPCAFYSKGTTCLLEPASGSAAEIGYSGFLNSVRESKKQNNQNEYQSPLDTTNAQCNGQGIYFLTDGRPNSAPYPVPLMQAALGNKGSLFSVPSQGGLPNGAEAGNSITAIGEFAKALNDSKRNPLGIPIKTAVVGFGSEFNIDRSAVIKRLPYINNSGVTTGEMRDYYDCSKIPAAQVDAKNACNWGAKSHPNLPGVGGYGEGGFYSAQSTDDVITSIVKFVDDVKPTFDPISTGVPTLPQDALNPIRALPYGYYASFTPTPQDSTQLWLGNLNKYKLIEGQLYGADGTSKLFSDGTLNTGAAGLWLGGVKGQLNLGMSSTSLLNRTLYTNRSIGSNPAEVSTLNAVTLDGGALKNDPQRNYWLSLLGYDIAEDNTDSLDLFATKTATLRQLGADMHSTPILLTQGGKIESDLSTKNREDYLLFGTTQGLLHVIDKDGKEVFAFVPNEMMESSQQRKAFMNPAMSTGGRNQLFYGIDAPWVAYTKYVANQDGSLTVGTSDRSQDIHGTQYVYGGLRMGGQSYYALDLADIEKPVLKFHINPKDTASNIVNSTKSNNVDALNYMGQSWSKPTIARVKFGGVSKLVMIVGGGYDVGYEADNYNQTNQKGAGIYMFDAENGDLLWWTSANATAAMGAQAFTQNNNLKYSVVSQINALDRDGDGFVDNLYFGDLGGQVFRIDLNNALSKSDHAIDARVVLLNSQHADNGISPRFYEIPSISVQKDEQGHLFVAVALTSGNRSNPLAGVSVNNSQLTASAEDGVFVIYDKDVGRSDLYAMNTDPTKGLRTQNVQLKSLNENHINGVPVTGNDGWIYRFGSGAGVYKGMNGLYAVDSILYANVYYRDGQGIGSSCGAGVKGDSFLYRFCLPTGKCDRFQSSLNTAAGGADRIKLGAGLLGSTLGAANEKGNEIKSSVTSSTNCKDPEMKNNIECQTFSSNGSIKTLRWYEMNK